MAYTNSPAPAPQQPAARHGVFQFTLGSRTCSVDAARAFFVVAENLDALNDSLLLVAGGLPTTPEGRKAWDAVVDVSRRAFGLAALEHSGSGASDAEALAVLLQFIGFAGLASDDGNNPPAGAAAPAPDPAPPDCGPKFFAAPAPGIN